MATLRIRDTKDAAQANNIPGPGTYLAPSDFGIYISSRFLRDLQKPAR